MNAPASGKSTNSGWIIYIKGVAFLVPALLGWVFDLLVLWPKLLEMWTQAGPKDPDARRVMNILLFLTHDSLTVLMVIIIALILPEGVFFAAGRATGRRSSA